MNKKCKEEVQKVDEILAKSCESKINTLKSCDEKEIECPCTSTSGGTTSGSMVDLIVLIDSSSSMYISHWLKVSNAAPNGIEIALDRCGVKAKVTYLYVDRVSRPGSETTVSPPVSGTVFNLSHEKYLIDQGVSGPFEGGDSGDYWGEEGAEAIMDLVRHNKWEDGACRAILYISDESFATYNDATGDTDGMALASQAASDANANSVTIFTHYIGSSIPESAEFQSLADLTGGIARIEMNQPGGVSDITEGDYVELLGDVICNGCGSSKCIELEIPEIKPCISISWGDSKCDSFETDDFEILCISVCNCYSNIAFNNFNISRIEITDSDGNAVANLPDGTPSVQVVPIGPICFGVIAPCVDGETSCVNREFVINTRGAKDGKYQVKLHGICFDVNFNYHQESCFKLELCKS